MAQNKILRFIKKNKLKCRSVVINEFEIPAFYSEVTEFTLVGLKDEEGKITHKMGK